MSNEKERLSLRVSPVTSYRLHTAYRKSGCRSMNELAEKAIEFYLDYLEASNAGDFLPVALKSYVDGRLGKLEERLSSLSFRQSVERVWLLDTAEYDSQRRTASGGAG